MLASERAASSTSSAPTIPPGSFIGSFVGPFPGVAPWQNVLITMATCVPPTKIFTVLGAGAQVKNCDAEVPFANVTLQLSVTVPLKPDIGASTTPRASWPPGEIGTGAPGLPPAGGVITSVKGTALTLVGSLAFAAAEPPPVTVTVLVTCVAEGADTFTVTVIEG